MPSRTREEQVLVYRILSEEWAWDFPATQWEADVVAELIKLPCYDVVRASADELNRLGVRQNECHENVRRCLAIYPGARAAVGWIEDWSDFAVHSVMQFGEGFVCVTPSASGDERLHFIPDAKISWTPDGSTEAPVRNGQIIKGPGVRRNPAFTSARFRLVRQRLAAGISVLEAGKITREEFESLVAEHF